MPHGVYRHGMSHLHPPCTILSVSVHLLLLCLFLSKCQHTRLKPKAHQNRPCHCLSHERRDEA